MACTVKNTAVAQERDLFKKITESAEFKKAEAKLNDILTNGITVEELMAEQKLNGKKNLITRTELGKDTDTVPMPDNYIEITQVWGDLQGFYFRLSSNQYQETLEDDVPVVITSKTYKKIKVEYTIEDVSKTKDLQTSTEELQKFANSFNSINSGDTTAARKLLADKIEEFRDDFNGVYNGVEEIITKIRDDANIPAAPSESIILIDKIKTHKGSNVITLEKPKSITKIEARKANTNVFFQVVQFKFIKDNNTVICDNLYEEYKVYYRGEGPAVSAAAEAAKTTGKFPSTEDVVNDVNSALNAFSDTVGNVAREITNVAGEFGTGISNLLSSASSGDLVNKAIAAAQNQPVVYSKEIELKAKATNAIALPELAGGESGVIEVLTKKEDEPYFTKMFKGNVSGWRLDGEDLFIPQVRAEIKVKYKKEIEPPTNTGVTPKDLINGPPLDPCKDLPPIGVKVFKELRRNISTGQVEEVVIKSSQNKPQPKKTPTIKAEPAINIAEFPTVVSSSSGLSSGPSTTSLDTFNSKIGNSVLDIINKRNTYFYERGEKLEKELNDMNQKEAVKKFKQTLDSSFKSYEDYILDISEEDRVILENWREAVNKNKSNRKAISHLQKLITLQNQILERKKSIDNYNDYLEDAKNDYYTDLLTAKTYLLLTSKDIEFLNTQMEEQLVLNSKLTNQITGVAATYFTGFNLPAAPIIKITRTGFLIEA